MAQQETEKWVRVVAGVVYNREGDYLLSSRPEGKPYAGYWEFAGGKVEPGETELSALKREFEEELGISIHRATPWLTKIHVYEHAHVHLRFFRVMADDWSGQLQAREGQRWSWQRPGDLTVSPMLPANGPILKALSVPQLLEGGVDAGFCGENCHGVYQVAPYASAGSQHAAVLVTLNQLAAHGSLPEAESVWILIEQPAQFELAQDADVLVVLVENEQTAHWVEQILQQGVGMPLVVLAESAWYRGHGVRWLAAGAHAVIEHKRIGLV